MNRSKIANLVFSGIAEMQKEDTLTDFEIHVGQKSFRCHKVVLASVSDYFRAMFSSGMRETVLNETTLEEVSSETMEDIIKLLYPDSDNIDLMNDKDDEGIAALLNLSARLQIDFLKKMCFDHFKITMSSENCIQRWKMSQTMLNDQFTEVRELAWKFMLDHFEELTNMTELLSLDFDDFFEVIGSDNLKVDSEDTVCKVILQWVKMDVDKRRDHVSDLLEQCCLTEVDRDFLAEEVAFMDILDRTSQLRVQEAIKFHRHPNLHSSMRLKFRACTGKEQVFVMVVKKNADPSAACFPPESPALDVVCWSRITESWMTINREWKFSDGFASCVHGDALYVSGGSGKNHLLTQKYTGLLNTMEEKEDLPFSLKKHAMVATNDSLFAVGGTSRHTENGQILKYNIDKDSWQIEGELVVPVESASVVVIGKRIYIFGGRSKASYGDSPISVIQMYDTKTQQSDIVCDLPSPCSFTAAVARRDHAFIVTGDGDVIQFTEGTNKVETVTTISEFCRENYGVNMADGKLFVYGGMDHRAKFADEFLDEVVVVDVADGSVSRGEPMAFACEVFGFGNIVVNNANLDQKSKPGKFTYKKKLNKFYGIMD